MIRALQAALRLGLGLGLALVAMPAQAQFWVTPESCAVTRAEIAATDFAAPRFAALQDAAAAIPNSTGRLWQITSPDGAVSHLWGTYHSNDPILLDLPAPLRQLLSEARAVAPELDPIYTSRRLMEHDTAREDWFRIRTKGFPTGAVDARVLGWIRSRTASVGWGREAPDYLTLGALASVLLADPCNDFAEWVYPIQDSLVQLLGAQGGAEIVGLESPDLFKTTLDRAENRDLALAVIALYGSYLDPDQDPAARRDSFAAYLQGRVGLMMAMDQAHAARLFGPERGAALLAQVDGFLLSERNLGFLETAQPLLQAGGAVLAVGCFHLPGETGLVQLMRARGYQVARVALPGEAP